MEEDRTRLVARVRRERAELLHHITAMTDKLMVGLALIWIGLMIGDFVGRLTPPLVILNYVIWAIFGLDFAVKFAVAPHKLHFLRTHWITIISLLLPAFRVLRLFQALSALRALSLVRILTSVNTSMGALSHAMGKKGLGYVVVITLIVLFGGAAGMYYFEQPSQLVQQGFAGVAAAGGGLHSYSDAVWWTAMLMTTIGSQYWPVTVSGRALCFLLSLFSLGVFGYITAALASFFVGQQGQKKPAEDDRQAALLAEIQGLRAELADIRRTVPDESL
jgi:voltage-gated potassium channel